MPHAIAASAAFRANTPLRHLQSRAARYCPRRSTGGANELSRVGPTHAQPFLASNAVSDEDGPRRSRRVLSRVGWRGQE